MRLRVCDAIGPQVACLTLHKTVSSLEEKHWEVVQVCRALPCPLLPDRPPKTCPEEKPLDNVL